MTSEDNHSKTSNVIKIFNPMNQMGHQIKEEGINGDQRDLGNEVHRKYEYSPDFEKEKDEYLSEDNESSESMLDEDIEDVNQEAQEIYERANLQTQAQDGTIRLYPDQNKYHKDLTNQQAEGLGDDALNYNSNY